MKVHLKIKRFNPEQDSKPYWGEYDLDMEGTDRVLDALHEVKWTQDGTLALRRSCAHGICGSDAMRINGRNRLACKVLLQDEAKSGTLTVEPILGLKDITKQVLGFVHEGDELGVEVPEQRHPQSGQNPRVNFTGARPQEQAA